MSMKYAILGVLLEGPLHNYRIADELERQIGGGEYHTGQISTRLRELEEKGWVVPLQPKPNATREQKPYAITAEGRMAFQRWLRAPLKLSRPSRDEVIVKFVFLGRHDPSRAAPFLRRLSAQLVEQMRGLGRLPRAGSSTVDDLFLAERSATLLRMRMNAEVQWIEETLSELEKRQPAQPETEAAPTVKRLDRKV